MVAAMVIKKNKGLIAIIILAHERAGSCNSSRKGNYCMKSTEDKRDRDKMVDMHQFFRDKTSKAMEEKHNIEAAWLIYSGLENRFFRTLQKYKSNCKYCKKGSKCKANSNQLAINTKIDCVKRLKAQNVSCISESFSDELLENIKKWVKKRNKLMHDLIMLATYNDIDTKFETLAKEGFPLLNELYDSCTSFRAKFYTAGYEFIFPEEAMEECNCKPKKLT